MALELGLFRVIDPSAVSYDAGLGHGCRTRVSYLACYNGTPCVWYRLFGLVVKACVSKAEDPGFEFPLRRDFPGLSHTSDLKIGTPVATLPGAWRYRVSAGTGRPGVSIL